jgi:hypothetical protein
MGLIMRLISFAVVLLAVSSCTPSTSYPLATPPGVTRMLEPWRGSPPAPDYYFGDYLHMPKNPKVGDCWQLPVPTCDITISGPLEVFVP